MLTVSFSTMPPVPWTEFASKVNMDCSRYRVPSAPYPSVSLVYRV